MKPLKVLAILCVLSLASVAYGQGTGDGFKNAVRGSKHDMTTPHGFPNPQPNFVGATALCEFCHAPHKYNAVGTEPPLLWNIQVRTGEYQTYSSSSFEGAATIRDPSLASLNRNFHRPPDDAPHGTLKIPRLQVQHIHFRRGDDDVVTGFC